MSFVNAVKETPLLKEALKQGLGALGTNSSKVQPVYPRKCEGSVDIDTAVKTQYPTSSRWDYALGYDGETHFIEVHSAQTSDVESVLRKLQWLKDFLAQDAPALNREPKKFHWIAAGKVSVLPGSSESRRLAKQGLRIIGRLPLK
ncbi:MAG: hypothetical protein VKK04_04860 [Synechococcales bacterium]|nr:hypothetical protein [Synechococcales bacterium]